MTSILGLDASLTSTGVAYRAGADTLRAYVIGFPKLKGMERIRALRSALDTALEKYEVDFVVMEGYAMGFRGSSNTIFNIGELGGVLKMLILERGIDILMVPPTSLKLFVTGKGNAKKEAVALAVRRTFGVSFATDDQSDAAGLLWMGETHVRQRAALRGRGGLPAHQKQALAGCSLLKAF